MSKKKKLAEVAAEQNAEAFVALVQWSATLDREQRRSLGLPPALKAPTDAAPPVQPDAATS